MKHLQVLLKPASSDCNLRCSYCFYRDEARKRNTASYGKMGKSIVEEIVRKSLDAAQESCTFGFQGGEPTLAGLDFYRHFAACVDRWKKKNTNVFYVLQTNGMLINEEWISFLKEKNVLVGLSMDGIRLLHDRVRRDAAGKGSYGRVQKTAGKLLESGVMVNVLCVLTRQNARKAADIYREFMREGLCFQQYIPCLDSLDEAERCQPWSLRPEEYAYAMKTLFDLWFEDVCRGRQVYVREFDNWVRMLQGAAPEACTMRGQCSVQYVIEANGDVFPCDFYVLDEFCMGNVGDADFWFGKIDNALPFLQAGQKRGRDCAACRWYPLCRGGCRRYYRESASGISEHTLCQAYRNIFSYCIGRLETLAASGYGFYDVR